MLSSLPLFGTTVLLLIVALVTATDAAPTFSFQNHRSNNLAFVTSSSSSSSSCRRQCAMDRLSKVATSTSSCSSIDTATLSMSSDWSNFDYLDDDDDSNSNIDTRDYAKEADSQEFKAQVGATLEGPSIDDDSVSLEPILVPTGSQLPLDEETVLGVLQGCRTEIGTLFGYTAENRGVGITGGVDFVEMDGPIVVLRLKGRFWHQRTTVLNRVSSYLQTRIPELIDVVIEDEWQLTDEANNAAL
jgi:hypothetical protein